MPTIAAKDVTLNYELSGPEGAPAVVFSNSLGATLEMWEAQAEALSGRYRCLRYDTRGHGRSSAPDRPVSVEELAGDMAALLDALGIGTAHVVGLSLGGMTAQAFGFLHPERALSLSLMATSAHLPPPEFWQGRADLVREKGPEGLVDAIIPRWFTQGFRDANPDAVRAQRDFFLMNEPRCYARCCEALAAMDLRDRIGAIAAPTLIIAGADDQVTPPPMAEDMRQRIRGSEMIVLPQAAHIISVEKADAVSGYLGAFLDRHSAGERSGN